ncbi:hypothetical protein SDC9_164563 [bioreactor metagenome]|uniref:Uncharacterized protein n=1 Tax=bioreactor metagenome TaxID=1076179 RepID=A0A645FZ63_9ZZZZ
MITHVPIIFRQSDTCINRCLTRRNRHIGSIGNENCSVCQRITRFRINDFTKLRQSLRHLVSALTAADIDDNICITPFCNLVLRHRFTGSETARYRCGSAFCKRKQRVNNPLTGNKRSVSRQSFIGRSGISNRPFLAQRQIMFVAICIFKHHNRIIDTISTVFFAFDHFA